ncbi:MAG TPA: DUF2087 domain-containing protein [Bacillota bacterium]|nr:DUF2087 domain-containing protein [Bacillota bacterium]
MPVWKSPFADFWTPPDWLSWPTKQAEKEQVTAYLSTKFAFDTSYHEREINDILKAWHTFSDWPLLRRELFERGYLSRNRDGTDYRWLK